MIQEEASALVRSELFNQRSTGMKIDISIVLSDKGPLIVQFVSHKYYLMQLLGLLELFSLYDLLVVSYLSISLYD